MPQNNKTVVIRMPAALVAEATKKAEKQDAPLSAIVRRLLREWVSERKKIRPGDPMAGR